VTKEQPTYRAVRLFTEDSSVLCYQYDAPSATSGIIWLGGVRGGLDSPASGLYGRLAVEYRSKRISSLRIRYRAPSDFERCVEDALLGIQFLIQRGISQAIVVGYSMGGAVAIEAAAISPDIVKGVAVIASQSYGTTAASRLSPRPLAVIQGDRDVIATVESATYIYQRAREPKELVVIPGADHSFDQHPGELQRALEEFIDRVVLNPQSNVA